MNLSDLMMTFMAPRGNIACFKVAFGESIFNFHLYFKSKESIVVNEQFLCLKF